MCTDASPEAVVERFTYPELCGLAIKARSQVRPDLHDPTWQQAYQRLTDAADALVALWGQPVVTPPGDCKSDQVPESALSPES